MGELFAFLLKSLPPTDVFLFPSLRQTSPALKPTHLQKLHAHYGSSNKLPKEQPPQHGIPAVITI